MPGFHVENFGCRAARADGEAVSERLRSSGHRMQQTGEASVVIVNTCSVTAEADREARAFIRRTHRLNPEARIVVTGCYAQRAPEELAGLAGVAAVVGNSHKSLVPQIAMSLMVGRDFSPGKGSTAPAGAFAAEANLLPIQSLLSASRTPIWADDKFAHSFLEEAQLIPGEQTRPNLKIQEGCGNRCTFCVIPQIRGTSRSLSGASILKQVRGFVAAGGNELVLSGINLGRWGRDLPFDESPDRDSWAPTLAPNHGARMGHEDSVESQVSKSRPRTPTSRRPMLAGLVRQIFRDTDLPRLRLSSIEPMDWDEEMIALMAEFGGTRLARHAHLPLQSGSDAVLRRMHRRYRPWHYAEKVAAVIQAAGPELTLGADVMVGFPGETGAEFEETLGLVRELPFGYLHLFPFSPRPGTRGWLLHAESPVPAGAVAERMAELRALAAEKSRAHREQFAGRELEAITLNTPAQMEARVRTSALTENFLHVELEGCLSANQLVRVRVTGLDEEMKLRAKVETASRMPLRHDSCLAG
jgi:threonylcarbamoyladenosine tRNA methylthiotransferase MtaB